MMSFDPGADLGGGFAEGDNLGFYDTDAVPDITAATEAVPRSPLWTVIVQPRKTVSMVGSLYIPDTIQDHQLRLNSIGRVVSFGPMAFRDRATGDWWGGLSEAPVKPGDWIMYGRYMGMRITFRGAKLLLLNDDELLLVVPDPDDIEVKL